MSQVIVRARPATEYWMLRNRRYWRTQFTAMLAEPILFLLALGVGVGNLVDDNVGGSGVQGVEYLAFIAPGLLAMSAMQQAFEESAWPVVGAVRWWRSYVAMQTTSMRVSDLMLGHLLFIGLRLTLSVTVFAGVGVLFGAFNSAWVLAAIPVAVLCGLAHATPVAAFAVGLRSEISLAALYRFVILPVSLFSGAFFPIQQLPVGLEQLGYLMPLWHGVDLCRDLALGDAALLSSLGHLAYLTAWLVVGYVLALRAYTRRLEP